MRKSIKIASYILLAVLCLYIFFYATGYATSWLPLLVLPVVILFLSKIGRKILLGIIGIIFLFVLLLQTDYVQNIFLGNITQRISKQLNTEVKIEHISLSFFDKMDMQGVLIKDQHKDTLLYAGSLKVRITDWFFFKDHIDLKYIGMENALIDMNRTDSVWNYQFIADYLSKPSPAVKDTSRKVITLSLQKVDLKKVRFVERDDWVGQTLTVKVGSMLMDANKASISKNDFDIASINLDKPYFSIENYDGNRPGNYPRPSTANDTGMYFNSSDMLLKIGSLKITDGIFVSMKRGDVPDEGLFDGAHIYVNHIDGDINHVTFIKDTIKAAVSLSALERSGLELKKLKADFRLTPQVMEFAHLDIRTNKSHLSDYYAMHFKDFNDDFNDYISHVVMDARFRNAEVNSDDIAYFAPELTTWKTSASFSGKFEGTVDDFKADNIFIRTSANSYLTGDLAMKGLPDMQKTSIHFENGIIQTNNKDLAFLAPALKTDTIPDFAALGNVLFRGNFDGTIYKFSTNGTLSTQLGAVTAKINMQLPEKGEPSYDGTVNTPSFDIGRFIRNRLLGNISFNGNIEGKSFSLDKATSGIDGNFDSLEFNGYVYHNLNFKGAIAKEKFSGDFNSSDPNFQLLSSVQINLSGKEPQFNILGDVAQANFKPLNFTNENFSLTGLFDLNFSGRNIDEFLGSAKILNASLMHDTTKLDFDSLAVSATIDSISRNKHLKIESNQFAINIDGRYNILDLPNSFQLFLNRYYPAYINPPKNNPANQHFTATIETKDFNKYAHVIDKRLSGFDNAVIKGSVNTENEDSGFYMYADIPFMQYDRYKVENGLFEGNGGYDSLNLDGDIGKIYIGDSTYFPNTVINIGSKQDHSVVHISTRAKETLNNAELNADVYTLEDGVRINFRPSSFVLNTKEWALENSGELVIRQNFASAKNVRFSQGFQEITVETQAEEGGNTNDLVVKLKNVNIGDITPLLLKKPRLEGLVDGEVYLRDFYNRFNADGKLHAQQFRLDDDSVGVADVTAAYNSSTGKITFKTKAENEHYNFDADGYYSLKDSTNQPLSINSKLNGTKVRFLNQFFVGLFSDIDGMAYGELQMSGKPDELNMIGDVTLKNGGLTVDYTKVHYAVDSALVHFRKDGIDFGRFNISDKYGNTGSVRGMLYENGFKNMRFDFDMASNKMLLLDTKETDNEQYYGKAIGRASLSLKGPLENLKMSIIGEATDTANISIVTSSGRESTDADFIVFKQYGKEIKSQEVSSPAQLNIDLDLTATNKATINVILDKLTGDVITATGNGRLKINVPASGDMTMTGRYNIESGLYNFNFQSFLRKPFELRKDVGNYIEWSGNPYEANMHIDAQYTAKNVTFNELLANTGYDLGNTVRGYRGEVYVIAHLNGRLSNPDIKFSFGFPQNSPIENDTNLKLFLDKVENDDNEMIKQVTFLIVFGSFSPYGQLGNGGNIAQSAGINTISQQITNELNKLISNLLTKITGDKSLQFDISTSTYSSAALYGTSSSQNRLDRQQINLKFNQSILNDKIIITFGTGLDFNISSAAVQSGNFQWLPDISIEFVLSKDRKLRAIVFNKSSLDVSTGIIGRRTKQGVSISYSFDFPREKRIPLIINDTTNHADAKDEPLIQFNSATKN